MQAFALAFKLMSVNPALSKRPGLRGFSRLIITLELNRHFCIMLYTNWVWPEAKYKTSPAHISTP